MVGLGGEERKFVAGASVDALDLQHRRSCISEQQHDKVIRTTHHAYNSTRSG